MVIYKWITSSNPKASFWFSYLFWGVEGGVVLGNKNPNIFTYIECGFLLLLFVCFCCKHKNWEKEKGFWFFGFFRQVANRERESSLFLSVFFRKEKQKSWDRHRGWEGEGKGQKGEGKKKKKSFEESLLSPKTRVLSDLLSSVVLIAVTRRRRTRTRRRTRRE